MVLNILIWMRLSKVNLKLSTILSNYIKTIVKSGYLAFLDIIKSFI